MTWSIYKSYFIFFFCNLISSNMLGYAPMFTINYIGFSEGIVTVQMVGACGTCPSATATLRLGVERLLMEEVPEVRGVEQI